MRTLKDVPLSEVFPQPFAQVLLEKARDEVSDHAGHPFLEISKEGDRRRLLDNVTAYCSGLMAPYHFYDDICPGITRTQQYCVGVTYEKIGTDYASQKYRVLVIKSTDLEAVRQTPAALTQEGCLDPNHQLYLNYRWATLRQMAQLGYVAESCETPRGKQHGSEASSRDERGVEGTQQGSAPATTTPGELQSQGRTTRQSSKRKLAGVAPRAEGGAPLSLKRSRSVLCQQTGLAEAEEVQPRGKRQHVMIQTNKLTISLPAP